MSTYTVKLKVILEVEMPVELDTEDIIDSISPGSVAKADLQITSICDWWSRLHAEHDIRSIEVVSETSN